MITCLPGDSIVSFLYMAYLYVFMHIAMFFCLIGVLFLAGMQVSYTVRLMITVFIPFILM